jgi:hypothetical protein
MTLLARLISHEEGYDIPGSLPNRDNNPGDLRHSPHSFHLPGEPNAIGKIDTPAHGWEDLERQLNLFAQRGLTLREAIYIFAPPFQNDSERYLEYICNGLHMIADTLVSEALKIP